MVRTGSAGRLRPCVAAVKRRRLTERAMVSIDGVLRPLTMTPSVVSSTLCACWPATDASSRLQHAPRRVSSHTCRADHHGIVHRYEWPYGLPRYTGNSRPAIPAQAHPPASGQADTLAMADTHYPGHPAMLAGGETATGASANGECADTCSGSP